MSWMTSPPMSFLSIDADDRVDDVVDVDERQLELAVAEHEPAAAGVARDRAVDQRDAAAEDLAGAQDHARQAAPRPRA